MKTLFIIFFGLSSFITSAQISGQFYMEGYSVPVIDQFGSGDLEGNFSIALSTDKPFKELVFDVANIKFKITNIPEDLKKLTLGTIELPIMKNMDVNEYKLLTTEQKKEYVPVYHYANLLGYEHKTMLDKDYILFACNGIPMELRHFSFDPKTRTIIIDAKELMICN